MRKYKLIAKIVDRYNVIIGYRLRYSKNGKEDVSVEQAIQIVEQIENAKLRGKHLALKDNKTSSLPVIVNKEYQRVKSIRFRACDF